MYRSLLTLTLLYCTTFAQANEPIVLHDNGGWCWFQDERAIIDGDWLITGSVKSPEGDVDIIAHNLKTGETEVTVLHPNFQSDDHNTPTFLKLPDGRYLVVYNTHGGANRQDHRLMRWSLSESPDDPTEWTEPRTIQASERGVCYSNTFLLPAEDNRIYNFHRGVGFDPNYMVSDDGGETFQYGGRLFDWKGDGTHGSGRPYVKYASNGEDTIHFWSTEDHPRNFDNSVYHGYYKDGKLYRTDGTYVSDLSTTKESDVTPHDFTKVFAGDADNVAWTVDFHVDEQGYPVGLFSVQKDSGKYKEKKRFGGEDHRYYYARWDGQQWNVNEMAYAGTRLFTPEVDYTGLAAINPDNVNEVYISTDADPDTGKPLISEADGKRHYEIFRGLTSDGGKSWSWTPITQNSSKDNVRPIIPAWNDDQTVVLWTRGKMTTWADYDFEVVAYFPQEHPAQKPVKASQPANEKDSGKTPIYPRETDPNSPRKSMLGTEPDETILRIDLDKDGDPDILERWWHGKRIRWIDEDDNATQADMMGDQINDALQIDRDGDGYFDGPFDINLKWADSDGDGHPDIELYASNPKPNATENFVGSSVFYVAVDLNKSGRFSGFNWENLSGHFAGYRGKVNWRPNYHGDSLFLKEHIAPWAMEDPRFSWENPFLFWDPDKDGVSEMAMRVADDRIFVGEGRNHIKFDGIVDEVWISYDVDNDAAKDNEKDHDFTLNYRHGEGIDYRQDVNSFPGLAAPDWALQYYRNPAWRKIDEFYYMPHGEAPGRAMAANWNEVYFTFDEDDDCSRWERVEIYYPGDPYVLKRGRTNGIIRHAQSDSLGDRGEWDTDYSGRGQLYIAPWDGKLHLYGAENGAWLVDRNRAFWGALHPNQLISRKTAKTPEEVVMYADKDGDGFFDHVSYDYDGDKKPERVVDFNELQIEDQAELIDPAELKWEGLYELFRVQAESDWRMAMALHREAMRLGFSDAQTSELTLSSGTHEKYENAYWIKETILRSLLEEAGEAQHPAILRAYYQGNYNDLVEFMEETAQNRQQAG